jgi:Ca2+-transporting ATPase
MTENNTPTTQNSWYERTADEVLKGLGSDWEGITKDEAARRLAEDGPNEIREKKKRGLFLMFLDQFRDFMILVLLGAAVISGIVGEAVDTIAIFVIIIINAIIGFIQEFRAERAMAALKRMASPVARVLREGAMTEIEAVKLVRGDVVAVEAGVIVPADMRLIDVAQLKIEEAALTGESVPVDKHAEVVEGEGVSLADRVNMAFKGTIVTYGRGRGVVTATGMSTELGRIAAMLQEQEDLKTPLQKRLAVFGRRMALAVLAICAIVFGMGLLRNEPPLLMFLTAISLAVAAIPEALPAVVTISLALGARQMVKLNALVKKLPAVETLGSITYICSDKTGTLTENRMTVEKVWVDGRILDAQAGELERFEDLLTGLAVSNDASRASDGRILGDPTEVALHTAANDHGFDKESIEEKMVRVSEVPFDSQRKCMTTFHQGDGRLVAFTKGAVDVLLQKSEHVRTHEGLRELDAEAVSRANEEMAGRGLRVIAIAAREWEKLPETISIQKIESKLTLLGLIGMMDPSRKEAPVSVAMCRSAGIKPVMITGDHPVTARVIARRVGILDDGDEGRVLTGRELDLLTLEELEQRVERVQVYARVAPEQKLKIVRALQDRGQFVAMTGDGVNDAPALKRADIGIAMGITGTDVSKEAAHMVLLDDNFATIVKAVAEGRKIYDNIRKFIRYLLTTNSGEIWTLFLAPIVGLPVPLLPIHILWINLVTDGLPALALSMEPPEGDVMKRPPRHPKESVFAHGLGAHALWVGLLMAIIVLGVQAWSLKTYEGEWQTMVFTVLCLTQLGHVLAIRSEHESLFTQGLFSNKALLGAVCLTIILQMATIYVPFLNPIFRTAPLSAAELIFTLAVSSLIFLAVEAEKWIRRRKAIR